jgi:hypothetical protein
VGSILFGKTKYTRKVDYLVDELIRKSRKLARREGLTPGMNYCESFEDIVPSSIGPHPHVDSAIQLKPPPLKHPTDIIIYEYHPCRQKHALMALNPKNELNDRGRRPLERIDSVDSLDSSGMDVLDELSNCTYSDDEDSNSKPPVNKSNPLRYSGGITHSEWFTETIDDDNLKCDHNFDTYATYRSNVTNKNSSYTSQQAKPYHADRFDDNMMITDDMDEGCASEASSDNDPGLIIP